MKRQDILENQAKIVFLGIGSNLGIRKRNIEKAKFLLAEHNLDVLSVSSYYETPSWPDPRKPKFLNIILKLKCYYSPQELLKICKSIENQLGRKKAKKNAPRTCDLDIIDFNKLVSNASPKTGFSSILKSPVCNTVPISVVINIADDSGIEVDALNGEPGIYSARYAGSKGPRADAENNAKLLLELEQVPEADRTARFQCVIVFLKHEKDPMPLICQGSWEGRILFKETGINGFGYDPLFYVPTHDCASAELDPKVKNTLSHRSQALGKLVKCWNNHL